MSSTKHLWLSQGTHCTGKTGKMTNNFPVRENTGNLEILSKLRENTGNFVKTQGILLAQVVNALILKVKGIAVHALFQTLNTGEMCSDCACIQT